MPSSPTPVSAAAVELGRRVRDRRHELGLTQEALAVRAGVHWTFVGQVERGRRNLTLHTVLRVAAGLDIDPGELVRGLKPPSEAGDS